MSVRLWLLEGLPGTGKTTAAQCLAGLCVAARQRVQWWPEEDRDHPATPASLRKRAAESEFPDLCVAAFEELVHREAGVLILEGSAFQSTVRFMFANGCRDQRIRSYLAEWAIVVAPARPGLLLFRVEDVPAHFDEVVANRGQPWIDKVVAYVERTPVALANGWHGYAGFLSFWTAYQQLVFDVAPEAKCGILKLQGWCEGRSFPAVQAFNFLSREGPPAVEGGPDPRFASGPRSDCEW